jgi:hypothetical protein
VTASLGNRGAVNGNKKVTVYVNGQEEAAQGVTVNSGGSAQLAFDISRSEPGEYSVYVDGTPAGSFRVEMFRESDLPGIDLQHNRAGGGIRDRHGHAAAQAATLIRANKSHRAGRKARPVSFWPECHSFPDMFGAPLWTAPAM